METKWDGKGGIWGLIDFVEKAGYASKEHCEAARCNVDDDMLYSAIQAFQYGVGISIDTMRSNPNIIENDEEIAKSHVFLKLIGVAQGKDTYVPSSAEVAMKGGRKFESDLKFMRILEKQMAVSFLDFLVKQEKNVNNEFLP